MAELFPGFDTIYLIPIFIVGVILYGFLRIALTRGKIFCHLYCDDNIIRHFWRKSGDDGMVTLKGSRGHGDYQVDPLGFNQERGMVFWIPRAQTWDEGHINPRVHGSVRESGHPTPEQLHILRGSRYIREAYKKHLDPWVLIAITAIFIMGIVIIYLIQGAAA